MAGLQPQGVHSRHRALVTDIAGRRPWTVECDTGFRRGTSTTSGGAATDLAAVSECHGGDVNPQRPGRCTAVDARCNVLPVSPRCNRAVRSTTAHPRRRWLSADAAALAAVNHDTDFARGGAGYR